MHSLYSLAWRNLSGHRLRSVLTALAIALGVAMVLAASIVGQAAGQSATKLSEKGPPSDLEVVSRDREPFSQDAADVVQLSPWVERAVPLLRVQARGIEPEIASVT